VGLTYYRWLATLGTYHLWEERREGRSVGYRVGETLERTATTSGYGRAVALLEELGAPGQDEEDTPEPPVDSAFLPEDTE